MTPCTRRLSRESAAAIHSQGRTREVIVELRPPLDVIGFRLKGTRTTWFLPVAYCYREAIRNELARRKAEKRKARAQR